MSLRVNGPCTRAALCLNLAHNPSCMPSLSLSLHYLLLISTLYSVMMQKLLMTVFLKWIIKAENVHLNPNTSQNTTKM